MQASRQSYSHDQKRDSKGLRDLPAVPIQNHIRAPQADKTASGSLGTGNRHRSPEMDLPCARTAKAPPAQEIRQPAGITSPGCVCRLLPPRTSFSPRAAEGNPGNRRPPFHCNTMRQPGYDTFGPQYPPEWDEVRMVRCVVCGSMVPDDETVPGRNKYGDRGHVCPDCLDDEDG